MGVAYKYMKHDVDDPWENGRVEFPIAVNRADTLLRLIESSSSNPFPSSRMKEPLSSSSGPSLPASPVSSVSALALIAPPSLASPADPLPLRRLNVSHRPPDADSPLATDVVQDFKAASARKRERWSRIAHLVEESEPHRAAALADAIVSVVGAEHADKLVLISTESLSLVLHECSREATLNLRSQLQDCYCQKVVFLRQQLTIINAKLRLEPGNTNLHGTGDGVEDEDELDLLICRVDTLPVGSKHMESKGHTCVDPSFVASLPRPATAARNGLLLYPGLPLRPPLKHSRSDFLTTSKSQLNVDHYCLEKAKAQEVSPKEVIDDPAAGANEADSQKENACRALIEAGEILALLRVPVPVPPLQSVLRAKGPDSAMSLFITSYAYWKMPLSRLALDGVRDGAEIRSHHRTYVASVPGLVTLSYRKDVEHDVPKEVRARMQFVSARTMREVLDAAFGEGALPWRTLTPVVESRL
ncbi:hypothetical protein H4582DRAFT_2079605 [Lactarius indigo]|nr:hypothetical protein H4582DRAFT_2079605 [Lactarius indigo]